MDVQANTFVVLGQTVRVTGTTVFDGGVSPADITGLSPGVSVEVSGFVDSTGVIVATRVEGKAAAGELEVSGALSGLDTVARRFTINALTIDYATATVSGGTLANGACVEVKSNAPTGNTFVATRVEVKSCGLAAAANDRGQIEGIITRFVSAADFDVNGQRVTTTASTTYVNGMASASASDLRLDLKVEVEGTFNAAGTLQASKVEIKPESSSRLLGTVDALNAGANTLSMYGIDVAINASTRMEDESSARISPLRFPDSAHRRLSRSARLQGGCRKLDRRRSRGARRPGCAARAAGPRDRRCATESDDSRSQHHDQRRHAVPQCR